MHCRGEDDVASFAFALRLVERHVSVLDVVGRVSSIEIRENDADASSLFDVVSLNVEWFRKRFEEAKGHSFGFFDPTYRFGQIQELVAAESTEGVRDTRHGLQPTGDGNEQLVAHDMSERIVDTLEFVKVEEQHRTGTVSSSRLGVDLFESIEAQYAIGQFREGIMG